MRHMLQKLSLNKIFDKIKINKKKQLIYIINYEFSTYSITEK